ncbi:MAG: DUF1540 domain-containing protein [Clostridium perfringens]|nr:DUF1540 domain-containing protein [Clostridium perfringens]
MTRIMCSIPNCINYINNQCTANTVKINRSKEGYNNINCTTYVSRSLKDSIENYFNIGYLQLLVKGLDYEYDIIHKIICNCQECTYNFANTCTSTDISVYGRNAEKFSQTYCKTFLLKL